MAEFPVPLDNLISYVKALHPGGGPLENVSDAFAVSTQMDEQADALIGYFVDQARKSGLSWSQIGGAMGVSKQAAQQRFVPTRAADLFPKGAKPFSRFTDRAARVLLAAGKLAAPEPVGAAPLAAALLTEPRGLAAKAVVAAGVTPEQVYAAVGAGPAQPVGEGRPGRTARPDHRRERQDRAQGSTEIGAAPRAQLHRHRAPAARPAVPRRAGDRRLHRPRPVAGARRRAHHRRNRRLPGPQGGELTSGQ